MRREGTNRERTKLLTENESELLRYAGIGGEAMGLAVVIEAKLIDTELFGNGVKNGEETAIPSTCNR